MISIRIVYIRYQIFERPPKRDGHFLFLPSILVHVLDNNNYYLIIEVSKSLSLVKYFKKRYISAKIEDFTTDTYGLRLLYQLTDTWNSQPLANLAK